ncbi:MAG TPA: DUF6036 family nucleotidyltransferase [Beijerinckiaceae bacterium]|jgi:hypothetical protein
MPIDRARVLAIFEALGGSLSQPTTLCLIGSTPAIMLGQDERQTQDIDVWHPASHYDAGELAQACRGMGVLFDPKSDLDPEAVYIQIVRPGIVSLPTTIEIETIGQFGKLAIAMPPPAIIAAAKLTRASERDIEDVAWWVRQRALDLDAVEEAIGLLPRTVDRETARDNMVVVRLVTTKGRK